ADNSDVINEDELMVGQEEVYSGLRSQDLQEAKDQLLVDTSDMLKIPLFTAEALLRNNEWSRELLLEKWMKDPMECCRDAGVQAPSTILHQGNPWDSSNCTSPTFSEDSNKSERMCEICVSPISEKDKTIAMSCKHNFCRSCWGSYLTIKIQSGDAHHIMCPAYQCHILVPVETIEKLVSPEMARRYLQFDIKAFVESNKSIKWCPVAGCGRAVRLPETEQNRTKTGNKSIPITSHAVDCGNSHFFCWECLGEAHAPCGCNQWQEWQKKIAEIKPEELKASCNESEDAANCLWLVTNSKPCPNCKSPIQKNEGCNHMKCSKHYQSNINYGVQAPTNNRHTYNRHLSVCQLLRRSRVGMSVSSVNACENKADNSDVINEDELMVGQEEVYSGLRSQDLQEAKDQLLVDTSDMLKIPLFTAEALLRNNEWSRELLLEKWMKDPMECCRDAGNELEEVAEKLSEMIARPYLRTPKSVIIQTTALARRKRHEFVRAVAQGLVPPETPPSQRKVKKAKYHNIDYSPGTPWKKNCNWTSFGSEEDLQNLETSIQEIDLQAPDHQCGLRCNRYNCSKIGSDYNVELVIALEMSRLQMIEDRLKQANTAVTPDPSSSISNNSSESNDDQLKLAIQLSLQDSSGSFNNLSEEETSKSGRRYFSKSNADITVDYFLKTLANHQIDLKNLEVDFNMLRNDAEKMKNEREFLFKPCNSGNEDGRFQISDIHENGFTFADDDEDFDDNDIRLKRSHSTGDLCIRRSGRRTRTRVPGDESRYHLDSDHSSQHDERPEEIVRKTLTLPSSSLRQNQHLLPHQEERLYEGQSSVDDTTSDSMNADMEVCEIMENVTDEDLDKSIDEDVSSCVEKEHQQAKKTERISQISDIRFHNPFASLKAKLCSAHLPKTYCLTKLAVNKSIGLLQETDNTTKSKSKTKSEKLASAKHAHVTISKSDTNPSTSTKNNPETAANYKTKFSKSTSFLHETHNGCGKKISLSNLKLKMPKPEKRSLETDSSNEYESETGIPRSPTLFISGVSISRTPEPKSPRLSMVSTIQQSRSSSISAPLSSNTLNTSNNSLNNFNTDTSNSFRDVSHNATPPTSQHCSPKTNAKHSGTANKENTKSKSASEPEREREVFKFPKSSTDGALSSVLHVQESNLSSDDFHEALFLFERSPKTRDSRRKKRSKKKDKEERREEASSAL
ncbi:ankyrin repeat and IBR domain-containing protein 1-like, partial [Agrilus planipennis]|uniref:RBR-type E3 ubiquitin transferase n=1 Tax=Agrilus planipennis TaxID=224129 RepID=A0A7F5RH09_AGRPL